VRMRRSGDSGVCAWDHMVRPGRRLHRLRGRISSHRLRAETAECIGNLGMRTCTMMGLAASQTQ
jgi:hypothetical protein